MNIDDHKRSWLEIVKILLVACICYGASPIAAQADIVIDNFSSSSFVGKVGTGSNSQTFGPGLPGVIGGANATRGASVTVSPGGGTATNIVTGGSAGFNSGTAKANFSLTYNANFPTNLGGLGSLAGFLGLHFDISVLSAAAAAGPGTTFTLTISDGTNTATDTITITTPGSGSIDAPFSSFTGIGSVNLGSVASISLTVDPNTGGNVVIQDFRTFSVPEPATMGIWSVVGMVGYGMRRRIKGLVTNKQARAAA